MSIDNSLQDMTDTEEWREIPSVPGYEASSHGRIRRASTGRIRKLAEHKTGYLTIMLHLKMYMVHRLIAEAFFGADERLVHHKDSDRHNNYPTNLEYTSNSANNKGRKKRGKTKTPRPVAAENAEWRTIPGYEPYQASSCGLIRRIPGERTQGMPLRPWAGSSGYYNISVCIDGKKKTLQVHQLIASAFHGECPEGHVVNHIDHVKLNNESVNLEYVTPGANAQKFESQLGTTQRGRTNARFSHDDVRRIKTRIANGESITAIAKEYGTAVNTVGDIKRGRTYGDVKTCQAHYQ